MAEKQQKLPSTFFNMVMVLTVIALVSALALGFTYSGTKDAIAMVEVKRTLKALNEVLPQFDNDPNAEKYTLEDEEYEGMEFFPAKKGGESVGVAVRTYSDNGFSERIWLIVGFTNDKKINNISVVKHKETPGLGTKMKEPRFKDQFKGKDPVSFKLKVKKDGGDVDAIAAATITSRAFCDATDKAYHAMKEDKPKAPEPETEKPEPVKPEGEKPEPAKPEVKKEAPKPVKAEQGGDK
jgi:electron transport complex protein RnfG